ncbi:uncharacterized protein LOC105190622 [Harpegnathos saltator]|uniref:uncharacterized protein LOC105190622 n=1 Tax=Harpegnathos saltator TaxID=610380 RepID=UPI000DBED7DC|nr:uncharacterized protein LOC105190622 [Harpegnathos saltator]
MAKTWTVVRFEDEDVVEAVPTKWIANGTCYWPTCTTEKVLKAVKDHVDFDTSWNRYKVYVFKNSTSESYYACRLKAKKAEDTSGLNSDCPTKRIMKKNRYYDSNYDVSSDSDNDANDNTLPSPPDVQDYSDTEIQTSNIKHDSNNNLPTSSVKRKCYNKENRRPLEMCRNKKRNINVRKTYYDSSYDNVPGPSNTESYTSNIEQKNSDKGRQLPCHLSFLS